jgi:hypothetical protein
MRNLLIMILVFVSPLFIDGSKIHLRVLPEAQAFTFAQTYGNTTYYSGDNQGTAQTYGNTTYYNVNGESGTAQTYGNTTYYNGNLFCK